jgi:hypothetical protein
MSNVSFAKGAVSGVLILGVIIGAVETREIHGINNDAKACATSTSFKSTGTGLVAVDIAGKQYVIRTDNGIKVDRKVSIAPC